ncbi:unnamed protein product [Mytilus edulis]|uniref:Uncharacterized protein n=1 Tax=Mytilus edulis TaxID=6550 RepID=A0A8S3UEU4_MYTED|nr:unnamed protein product [Mytilus edulis]
MLEGLQNEEKDVEIKLLKKGTDVSVKRLCETRWTARVDTVSSLLANYKSVYAALTKIENVNTSETRTNASGYRRYLIDPECIIALLVVKFVLSILKPLTLFLQKTDCNMVDAFEESKILLELLQQLPLLQSNIGELIYFSNFWDHVISEMQHRFPDEVKNQMLEYYLIPKNVGKLTPELIEPLSKHFWT